MELKYVLGESFYHNLYVLIVPLWNWNNESVVLLSKLICFNRTFMELKLGSKNPLIGSYKGFNRTFMELKFDQ